jgi:hypothetical protein
MIGTLIQASAAPQAVAQIIQAEQAGVPAIWATGGGIEFGLLERTGSTRAPRGKEGTNIAGGGSWRNTAGRCSSHA